MENMTPQYDASKKSKKGIIGIIIALVLVALLAVGGFVLYPIIQENYENSLNQKAADEVIDLIDTLRGEEITLDSANKLTIIKLEYDSLNFKQKKLVTNYNILKRALEKYDVLKNGTAITDIIALIDGIDAGSLSTDMTVIDNILTKYNALTEEQKLLVTNIDKLYDYQALIKENIEAQAALDIATDLVTNFTGYSGTWGDFGAHVNKYQGMIEETIKRDFKFREYFECKPSPNVLEMHISRFVRDDTGFGLARCTVSFEGVEKGSIYNAYVYGEIIVKKDGTMYYTMDYYY